MKTIVERRKSLLALIVALVVLAVYGRMVFFDFVYFDDHVYVIDRPEVKAGLTWESLRWALTALEAGFWQPLTWISFMVDYELWGQNPGGYHLTNILFHLTNTLLLFAALNRLTGEPVKSILVAALFAIHPLHVEPVAWIAARKDLVCGLFWMLTLLSYARYVERPGRGTYGLVLLSFIMALAAKAVAVTIPFILLLVDIWPCRRLKRDHWLSLVVEKIPMVVLALAVGGVTWYAEGQADAIKGWEEFPLTTRMSNAVVAYAFYLYKTFIPLGLSVHYPHPGTWPTVTWVVSLALLIIISCYAAAVFRRSPYFLIGWLWYILATLPMVGIVQIGSHAFADRYTYLSLTGVFIALMWRAWDAVTAAMEGDKGYIHTPPRDPVPQVGMTLDWESTGVGHCVAAAIPASAPRVSPVFVNVVVLGILSFFALVSFQQTGYWRNAETLFRRAVAVTDPNALAHNNLGAALSRQGRHGEALEEFRMALVVKPRYMEALFNAGTALAALGRYGEAIFYYKEALALQPRLPEIHNNLAIAYAHTGDDRAALFHFQEALHLRPGYGDAAQNLKILTESSGWR